MSLCQGSPLALMDWMGQSSSPTAALGSWLGMNKSTGRRGAARHAPGDAGRKWILK